MGIMSNSGGKGSGVRPLSVSPETFATNFDNIDWGKSKDKDPVPVKEPTITGNVDSDNVIDPEASNLEKMIASVPEELYNNSAWVQDICAEVNKVLPIIKEVNSAETVAYVSSRNGFICKDNKNREYNQDLIIRPVYKD